MTGMKQGGFPATRMFVHARACDCTHNQDGQRHARSQVGARASPARIPQCHEPLAVACLQAGQCQPQRSSVTQTCRLGLCQCALWPCGGSSRGM